ncbi:GTP-binding protein [Streptomyces sp. NPDC055025]
MPLPPESAAGPFYLPAGPVSMVKILIAGGLGVGKSTLVRTVSEVRTLHTEETLTAAGNTVDSLTYTPGKTATTVGIDYGRLTLDESVILYLFGSPGQDRFSEAWQDAALGARGAVVLLDLRRPEESYEALSGVEAALIPYIVAVNTWADTPNIGDEEIRTSLDLHAATPLIRCNALDPRSCIDVLITLTQHALEDALR